MMSMMKKRGEAARKKRLDHAFTKADDNCNMKITPQQMIKLFAANGEVADADLEKDAKSLAGRDGWISKHDFIKYAFGTDLCKEEQVSHLDTRNLLRKEQLDKKASGGSGETGSSASKRAVSRRSKPGKPLDKVELTFKKFDTNKDGYLSREEFNVMMKDVEKEQADRIFRSAGSERIGGDGRRISLEEFRRMLESEPNSKNTKSKQ